MRPVIEGCYFAGKIWSFRSKAYSDLNMIYGMLSDIPRCDTKTEILSIIKQSRDMLAMMEHRIKENGNDYTLNDEITENINKIMEEMA